MDNKTDTKICIDCGLEKSITDFYLRGDKLTYRTKCKECFISEGILLRQKKSAFKKIEEFKRVHPTPNTKICSLCQIEKPLDDFYFRNDGKKYRNECKPCLKAIREIPENKEIKKERSKKRAYKETRRVREQKKLATDPSFKLHRNMSRSLRAYFKDNGLSKNGIQTSKYLELLGYNFTEFKTHMELHFISAGNEWMSWQNWGPYNPKTHDTSPTWNLDHIIPLSDLSIETLEDENFRKAWSLENLRPLDSKQNILDGVNRTRHTTKPPKTT